MSSVGNISLDLNINRKKFNKQVDGIKGHTTKAFSAMSVAIGNIFANMATKAVESIGNFVKDSIDKGSELTELENVVDSVFTTMSDKVDTFAKNALNTYGLTEKQAKKMVGTFGAMSKSFGYSEQQAYNMSTALAGLAGDVASFYNLDIDEAYTKMKSVFTGETETLKELGVVMTQAALDEFAMSKGIGKTTAKMSEQEKVALRLAFVQDKLKTATGDVIRTQDSWANQTRKLSGQIDSFKTAIGQGLINILTPVIKVINTVMAKLVQLANVFKSFTEMIMGKKSGGGGAGVAMGEVAEAAETAAGATGGIEDAANGAASAAKKAQKSLMGFDEINKLQKQPDESGADVGSGGKIDFGNVDFGEQVKQEEQVANSALDKIKERLKELADLFKEGFKAGLGDDFEDSIARIKDHIKGIGESLKEIFTDPDVVAAANKCVDKIVYALGQITGSIVSIGASLAEMLVGGIDKYLEQNKDFIKDRLVGIFDATGEFAEIAGNLAQSIASIFEVFRGDTAKQAVADFIGIFENASLGLLELGANIGRDLLNCIAQPIIENQDKIKEAIENTLKPVSTILSALNKSVKETFDKIFEVYDSKIRPAFEGIADGLSSLLSTILDTYNTYVSPVLDNLSTKFSDVWASKIQPTLDKAIELIGKVADFISTIWKTVLVPFVNWIISTVVPLLMPIIEQIGKLVLDVFGAISKIIGGIIDVLGGLIDFITGVFKGDWEQCWEGCKSIFEGFCGIIEGLLSGLISVITGILSTAIDVIVGIVSFLWEAVTGIFTTAINAISSLITTSIDFIFGVITNAGENIRFFIETIWNTIKGITSSALEGIKNIFSSIWEGIVTLVTTFLTTMLNVVTSILRAILSIVSSVWNGILSVITSIINKANSIVSSGLNGIKNTFTSVFNSIKSTVISILNSTWNGIRGVINSILGGVERMANGVINGINGMASALSSVRFNVPSWVPGIGGNSFALNIPRASNISLPRLAEGGYVRANQPQPVIVGDNKTQGEIISPENKMLEVFMEALEQFFGRLRDSGYSSNGNGEVGDIVIPIYLDGSMLDEVIVTAQQRRSIRSGGK